MKKFMKKVGILLGIFVIAVAVYFIWNQKTTEKTDVTVYTSVEEAVLPVVYTDMFGKEMNLLHGYTQDMKQKTARESLTVLPEDRALSIRIAEYEDAVTAIRYEVRNLDLSRLVERTTLTDWEEEGSGVRAVLPIQNLLSRNEEYLLTLSVDTELHGTINYYTRIMWSDNPNVQEMIHFAEDFTNRTFDYDQARELVTYLETNDAADNSSLGHVTIESSFSQLTWSGLQMQPVGDIRVTLKELDGIMCNVQLNYNMTRASESGGEELYEVVDNYTMKWDSRRIYLMDFDRKTDQIFSGHKELFSGKRIMLGITNEDAVRSLKSSDGNQLAFVANRELWGYDQSGNKAVKIFSFRSGKDDGVRSGYDQHDMKILSVMDSGDVDFLVYGYMNRGIHEGSMGIAMYHYNYAEDAIQEKFFIPAVLSFEELESDVRQLAHLGTNGMLYIMVDHAVFGIDLNGNEYMVLADGLTDGNYAVSMSGKRFAWQEGGQLYGSRLIHLMDLETGSKQEIKGNAGDLMRTLGFVGDDFVFGVAREGDEWIRNGRIKDLPIYSLQIMGNGSEIIKRDEPVDSYISDVEVEDGRIHLNRITRTADHAYTVSRADIIVCNKSTGIDPMEGIGWYASEERRKLYFVQVDQEIKNSRDIKISTPKTVVYDTSENLDLKANMELQGMLFYAYGGGHLLGTSQTFSEAVELAYDRMGIVTDSNQRIVWDRVNRRAIHNIKDPMMAAGRLTRYLQESSDSQTYEAGVVVLDARNCVLGQVLYFIDKGCPVLAYIGEGTSVLITGYDQYNISLYDPAAQTTTKMGLNDATEYFNRMENDFICGLFTE